MDKYTIVESERTRTVHNWLQYFAPEDFEMEFRDAGFSMKGLYSDVAEIPYDQDSSEFAVIATRAQTGTLYVTMRNIKTSMYLSLTNIQKIYAPVKPFSSVISL